MLRFGKTVETKKKNRVLWCKKKKKKKKVKKKLGMLMSIM